jgi:hypothetical protein
MWNLLHRNLLPYTGFYKKAVQISFKIIGSIFSVIKMKLFNRKKHSKHHEKHFIHHSSNINNRLVVRCFLLECYRFNSYTYCTGYYSFITRYYTPGIKPSDKAIYFLSHIHGPFYQQGYSSPL